MEADARGDWDERPRVRDLVRLVVGLLLVTAIVGPHVALALGCFVLPTSSGNLESSAFGVALTLLDPARLEAVRNSLLGAAGSSLIGVALGSWLGRAGARPGRLWAWLAVGGRMAAVVGLLPSAFGAVWWLDALSVPDGWQSEARWAAWLWVHGAFAAAWLATALAGRRGQISAAMFEPIETGRSDGRRKVGRIRRRLIRRHLAPSIGMRLGALFGVAFLDPIVPMVLGLRRSVGFQIVESVSRDGWLAPACVLAIVGVGLAWGVGVVGSWWGGIPRAGMAIGTEAKQTPLGVVKGGARVVLLVLGGAFSLAPVAGLIGLLGADVAGGWQGWAAMAREAGTRWVQAISIETLEGSIGLGLVGSALGILLGALVSWSRLGHDWTPGLSRLGTRASWGSLGLAAGGPVAVGLGLWAVVELLRFGAEGRTGAGVTPLGRIGPLAAELQAVIEPVGRPGVLLAWCLGLLGLPVGVRGWDWATSDPATLKARREQAITLGAGPWRAVWMSRPRRLIRRLVMALGTLAVVGAASTVPGLFLDPTGSVGPLGSATLMLGLDPAFRGVAAIGALGLVLARSGAFLAARRGRIPVPLLLAAA